MATTLKITPTLEGKSSEKFNQTLSENKSKKVSEEAKARMKTLVSKIVYKSKS